MCALGKEGEEESVEGGAKRERGGSFQHSHRAANVVRHLDSGDRVDQTPAHTLAHTRTHAPVWSISASGTDGGAELHLSRTHTLLRHAHTEELTGRPYVWMGPKLHGEYGAEKTFFICYETQRRKKQLLRTFSNFKLLFCLFFFTLFI